eukprot:scaffold912_cov187-Ochromonas_danica.AAC.34
MMNTQTPFAIVLTGVLVSRGEERRERRACTPFTRPLCHFERSHTVCTVTGTVTGTVTVTHLVVVWRSAGTVARKTSSSDFLVRLCPAQSSVIPPFLP